MKKLVSILQLNFLPGGANAALLVLRVWFGLSLFFLHGLGKLERFKDLAGSFPNPIGIGSKGSLILVLIAEALCPILVAIGLFTRLAAFLTSFMLAVAFFRVHQMALSGEHTGELAFIHLAAFVTIFIAGAGRFSLDARLTGGKGAKKHK